jgi:hypothetical protein
LVPAKDVPERAAAKKTMVRRASREEKGKGPLPEDEPWDSEDSANTSSSENTEAEGNVGTKSSDDDSGSEDEEDELDEGGKPNPASARSDDKGEDFDKEGQSGGYESDDS